MRRTTRRIVFIFCIFSMRNHSIDVLKFIFAIIVVIIHGDIPNTPKFLVPIRFVLFCFFMISGYLIEKPDITQTNNSIKKSINHLVKTFIYCFLIFFPTYLFIVYYFKQEPLFNEWNIINIVVFNETPFWMHFWYLSAYFYLLIFMYLINKIPYRNTLINALPLLLIVALLLGPYSELAFGRNFEIFTYRNAWFMGLPSFCLGAIIKRTQIYKYISSNILFSVLVISALLPYFEARALHNYYEELYLSNILFAFFLLLAVLKHPLTHPNFLSNLGVNYSMELYIIHPLFIFFIRKCIWLNYGESGILTYLYFETPIVIILSLCVLKLWHMIKAQSFETLNNNGTKAKCHNESKIYDKKVTK